VALTQQLDSTVDVLHSVTKGKSGEEHDELVGLMYFQFFLPIHEQINEILKTKVHLLEGAVTPESFVDYFKHYAIEKAFRQLKRDQKDVSQIVIPRYPPPFYYDVRAGYGIVLKRYEDAREELRQRPWSFWWRPGEKADSTKIRDDPKAGTRDSPAA
jgi:hypothetical protein